MARSRCKRAWTRPEACIYRDHYLSQPGLTKLGGISIIDLPLRDLQRDNTLIKHIVDIVTDITPPNKGVIEQHVNEGRWSRAELPEPFCQKADMEVKLITQFVVLPQANGNVTMLKHMYSADMKLGKAAAESLCYGKPQTLQWQGQAVNFRKACQWFLGQLGGWQCRQYALAPVLPHQQGGGLDGKRGCYMSSLSESEVDLGFLFIEEQASSLGTEWKRVQWMTKHVNTKTDSPIFQWPHALVERSIRALQNDGALANPVDNFHFTLADLEYSVLDFAVRYMLKTLKTHSNGIIGGPGSGKTPLARIIAMCTSRYWKRILNISTPPSHREASEFDFFRGQPGRRDRPDIHDDGCLASEPIRELKGFADVGCAMMTKERWGAAKFVQGQMRVFVCNDYEFTTWLQKHQGVTQGTTLHMSHEEFLKVITPMFPKDTEHPHIMAVLKRANILVNAGKIMIFRPATQEEIWVQCVVTNGQVDYLKPTAAVRYQAYRDNQTSKPDGFEADLA